MCLELDEVAGGWVELTSVSCVGERQWASRRPELCRVCGAYDTPGGEASPAQQK